MNYQTARQTILKHIPTLTGWTTYPDGIATGPHPPWIVISFRETTRDTTEALAVTTHHATLTIRVVGESETGVNIACEKLQNAIDGVSPEGMSALVPDVDSGTYPSELQQPHTSTPYIMRVLSWQTGWTA
ncbi:hypothetical protein [Bifidobacterium vansinderenii]|uniref:Uncharacterized protein n=1 Tax=Bifidobacterium vansinderenii TaxID=1984871 RepID=A0A229W0S0_9BIFI|nr:hypothetical protein [Bifidobacterium vansinderenii]OXN01479.1 hypothetical protein Tam10B_0482 [Bifidobacterium vansinderenii]